MTSKNQSNQPNQKNHGSDIKNVTLLYSRQEEKL